MWVVAGIADVLAIYFVLLVMLQEVPGDLLSFLRDV